MEVGGIEPPSEFSVRLSSPRVVSKDSLRSDSANQNNGTKAKADEDVRRARNRRTYLPNSLVLDIL